MADADAVHSAGDPVKRLLGTILGEPLHDDLRDTLDEPVSASLRRDYDASRDKARLILSANLPTEALLACLAEWDMWGPLLFSLSLAMYRHTFKRE